MSTLPGGFTKTTTILGGRFYDGCGNEPSSILGEGVDPVFASLQLVELLPPEALVIPSGEFFGQEGYYEITVTFVPTPKKKET